MNDTPKTNVMMKFCFGTDQEYIRLVDAIKLERELNAANKRILWLESAVQDSIHACEWDIGILEQRMSNLKTAKEAKP